MRDSIELKTRIIEAGYIAIEKLIEVAKESIIKSGEDEDISADRLKNAAASKRLAVFDAFEILSRIESESESIELSKKGIKIENTKQGFAERRSIQGRK